jgi:plasmid maintenance system killer protein
MPHRPPNRAAVKLEVLVRIILWVGPQVPMIGSAWQDGSASPAGIAENCIGGVPGRGVTWRMVTERACLRGTLLRPAKEGSSKEAAMLQQALSNNQATRTMGKCIWATLMERILYLDTSAARTQVKLYVSQVRSGVGPKVTTDQRYSLHLNQEYGMIFSQFSWSQGSIQSAESSEQRKV